MTNFKNPSNDGDELDYLYHLLKDEPSVEKIAFPLFSNLLFTWSPRNLFQLQERERLLTLARNEAEMLILPLPLESVPMKHLALEFLTRYVIFSVFNNAEIRKEFLANSPMPFKDERKVYDSLVYLIWQDKICKRYHDVLIERLRLHPIAKHTFVLTAQAKEADWGISSPNAILASQKSFQFLLKEIFKEIKFKMPLDEKKEWINSLLGKWIIKLKEMPFEKLCHEAFFTDRIIKTDFIDEWRMEHRERRYPEGGFDYLDAETMNSEGREISRLELLERKCESLQTQPMDIRFQLTASQKKALREFLSDTEVKILEFFYNYPDFAQEEVAAYVGCTQSKISKARRKFKRFRGKIKKILEIQ